MLTSLPNNVSQFTDTFEEAIHIPLAVNIDIQISPRLTGIRQVSRAAGAGPAAQGERGRHLGRSARVQRQQHVGLGPGLEEGLLAAAGEGHGDGDVATEVGVDDGHVLARFQAEGVEGCLGHGVGDAYQRAVGAGRAAVARSGHGGDLCRSLPPL